MIPISEYYKSIGTIVDQLVSAADFLFVEMQKESYTEIERTQLEGQRTGVLFCVKGICEMTNLIDFEELMGMKPDDTIIVPEGPSIILPS